MKEIMDFLWLPELVELNVEETVVFLSIELMVEELRAPI